MMIAFFRRWYIAVALVWWLCGLAVFLAVARSSFRPGTLLSWVLMLIPVIVPAVLLASRGFRHTSTVRVFVSLYAVVLVPTGLFMLYGDVVDNVHDGWANHHWLNTWVWFQLALEGGLLASPFVFGFSAVVAYVNNLFVKDSEAD
jgi:hypothetical protein